MALHNSRGSLVLITHRSCHSKGPLRGGRGAALPRAQQTHPAHRFSRVHPWTTWSLPDNSILRHDRSRPQGTKLNDSTKGFHLDYSDQLLCPGVNDKLSGISKLTFTTSKMPSLSFMPRIQSHMGQMLISHQASRMSQHPLCRTERDKAHCRGEQRKQRRKAPTGGKIK